MNAPADDGDVPMCECDADVPVCFADAFFRLKRANDMLRTEVTRLRDREKAVKARAAQVFEGGPWSRPDKF